MDLKHDLSFYQERPVYRIYDCLPHASIELWASFPCYSYTCGKGRLTEWLRINTIWNKVIVVKIKYCIVYTQELAQCLVKSGLIDVALPILLAVFNNIVELNQG